MYAAKSQNFFMENYCFEQYLFLHFAHCVNPEFENPKLVRKPMISKQIGRLLDGLFNIYVAGVPSNRWCWPDVSRVGPDALWGQLGAC